MAESARKLGILGINDEMVEKRRRLCQFLFLCDCIYMPKPITGEELDSILRYVSAARKNLEIESFVRANGTNFCENIYKPLSMITIRIVELGDENGKIYRYYYEEYGFTIKEVMTLLNGLRDYPVFVGNFSYSEDEIKECIELLRNVGLLRITRSYNDEQEPRYCVGEHFLQQDSWPERHDSIEKMKDKIWNIHAVEMYYLGLEGMYHKLTDHDKEELRLLFGSIGCYKITKAAYSRKKKPYHGRELKRHMNIIDAIIDLKIKDFYEKYQHIVRENYLFCDLVKTLIIRDSNLKTINRQTDDCIMVK
jgi:hemerythrin superfamily protein